MDHKSRKLLWEAVATFAWGRDCCHADRLGKQESVQLANTTIKKIGCAAREARAAGLGGVSAGHAEYCTVLYGKKIQPENSRKFRENSKNGRAPRAKCAVHAHFWEFSGFLGIFRIFSPYNTVHKKEATKPKGREL